MNSFGESSIIPPACPRTSIHPHLLIVAVALCLSSCGSTSFYVPVRKPAEVNLLAYKRIAINEFLQDIRWSRSRFPDAPAQDVADEITRALLRTGKFEILDRRFFDMMPREQRSSDGSSETGKLIPPTCLLSGRVSQLKYDEEKKAVEVRRKDKPPAINNIRHGICRMEVILQVTDFAGGRILWNRRFRSQTEATAEAMDAEPGLIDEDLLRTEAQSIIVKDFLDRIFPLEEMVAVTMLTDGDMDLLEKGIKKAKLGEWDDAIRIFTEATEAYKPIEPVHKAWFNLGVAHQYHYDFRAAEAALKQALALKDDGRYKYQLQSCYSMEKEYMELLKQEEEIR